MAPAVVELAGRTPSMPLPVPYSAGCGTCSTRAVDFGASLTASLRSIGATCAAAGAGGGVGAGAVAGTAAGTTICGGPADATFTGAARTTRVFTLTGCSGVVEPGMAGWELITPLVIGAGRCDGAAGCDLAAWTGATRACAGALAALAGNVEIAAMSRCALAPSSVAAVTSASRCDESIAATRSSKDLPSG